MGISVESVWFVPSKPHGGGLTVVYLEAEDPERVLRELAASDAPFDSCYSGRIRKLFGFDLARILRAASGESFTPGAMMLGASPGRRKAHE